MDKPLVPSDLLQHGVSWDALVGVRSRIKLRAGALDLARKDGRRSSASVKACIYCDKKIRSGYLHCLGECAVSACVGGPWPSCGLCLETHSSR